MTDWETQWITHPDYPGWRKRRSVSPDGMMSALIKTPWVRIPGSDPNLPPPPKNDLSPPWGEGIIPKFPEGGRFPDSSQERPNLPNTTLPRMYNMPSPYPKKTLEHMVPQGGGGGGINPPWANMLKPDMTRDITIPPARRRHFRGTEDPATGQNRLIKSDPTYPDQSDNFKKMQDIQEAYFSGADFGYEEGWPERLKVSEQMINMFMSTPEEAIIFAFENPTDAVLEEFERNYGWPLNVNSPALRKYVMQMKGQNGV